MGHMFRHRQFKRPCFGSPFQRPGNGPPAGFWVPGTLSGCYRVKGFFQVRGCFSMVEPDVDRRYAHVDGHCKQSPTLATKLAPLATCSIAPTELLLHREHTLGTPFGPLERRLASTLTAQH